MEKGRWRWRGRGEWGEGGGVGGHTRNINGEERGGKMEMRDGEPGI